MNEATNCKKYTANDPLCVGDAQSLSSPTIGRYKAVARTDSSGGRPAVRFNHSLSKYNGRLFTSRGLLEAMLLG